MNWQETYNKRKDTGLMKEFEDWYYDNGGVIFFKGNNIKDVWGYLICFAETKGYELRIVITDNHLTKEDMVHDVFKSMVGKVLNELIEEDYHIEMEQAMLWCADKFFEVVNA